MTETAFGRMTQADVAAIVAFDGRVGPPGGAWHGGAPEGGAPEAGGAFHVPWFELSPALTAFYKAAYAHGLVVSFDWSRWTADGGGGLVFAAPEQMAGYTLEEVQRVVTAIIRGDRFAEGTLAEAIADGRIAALVRRVAVLAREG